ncbi:MAG: hypothetical protein ABW185_08165, partial [Sedimenticola sp.]
MKCETKRDTFRDTVKHISLAAILKLKMDAPSKSSNLIVDVLILLLDPENMGIDSRITILIRSDIEIYAKAMLGGGHFEIRHFEPEV